MDRKQFKKELENTDDMLDKHTMRESLDIIHDKTAPLSETASSNDGRQGLIAIEELCELAIEISRTLRGRGDRIGLIEEIADVHIILSNIQSIYGITDSDVNRAVQVKIENAFKKMESTQMLY